VYNMKVPVTEMNTCPCGTQFTPARFHPQQVYCSRACQAQYSEKRKTPTPRHKRMTARDKRVKLNRQRRVREKRPTFSRGLRQILQEQGLDYHEVYAQLYREQSGLCAICGKPPGQRRLHMDHCHRTGRIRGLLCYSCNTKLGFVEKYLQQIVTYLRRYPSGCR
jgi:hypothetical protein